MSAVDDRRFGPLFGVAARPGIAVAFDDVLAGLAAAHKHVPSRLLFDDAGSDLYDQLAELDAYYPGWAEYALIRDHAGAIARHVGPHARVLELGNATCGHQSRALLGVLAQPASYLPIDTCRTHLERGAARIRADFPDLEIVPVTAEYTQPFALPPVLHAWRTTLVVLPAALIGTFEPGAARSFLAMLRKLAGADGLLLVGADATRDPELLARAYDDEHGVTAAFDKNVLAHLNRTRGATFDLDAFEHRAVWNSAASRVELQLVSRIRQVVHIDGQTITLAPGEPITTEHCYKHTPEATRALLGAGGWRPRQVFMSTRVPYRLWLCEPLRWA
ncbi:MAG: L-histidine N(alpha)-methyltransferase [Kofleriaceae bacterium]|nr:L-histidine N(alpha)-methyltransferase [Kofleriaceae bacterium]